jgi:hypothetical protein
LFTYGGDQQNSNNQFNSTQQFNEEQNSKLGNNTRSTINNLIREGKINSSFIDEKKHEIN